jgi:hypothetical protein
LVTITVDGKDETFMLTDRTRMMDKTPRADGLSYGPSDFTDADGTHQSPAGQLKVGKQLLHSFKTDSTAKG